MINIFTQKFCRNVDMMCSTIESKLQCIGVELVLAGNLSYTGNARVQCAFGNFSIKVFSNLAFVPPPSPFNEIPHPSRLSTIEAKGKKKKKSGEDYLQFQANSSCVCNLRHFNFDKR